MHDSTYVNHYQVYPEITKVASSIDAKTEPHEGRTWCLSISMHRYKDGVYSNKGDKVVPQIEYSP